MSTPEGGAENSFPLDPDSIQRILAEMAGSAGNAPDFPGTAIATIAGIHAQWYRAWVAAGIPESRAAEAFVKMVEVMFRSAS